MNKLVFALALLLISPALAGVVTCPTPTTCPAPLSLTRDQLQAADADTLITWLTSRGIGRKLFAHTQMPVEQMRAMALRHYDIETGAIPAAPPQ